MELNSDIQKHKMAPYLEGQFLDGQEAGGCMDKEMSCARGGGCPEYTAMELSRSRSPPPALSPLSSAIGPQTLKRVCGFCHDTCVPFPLPGQVHASCFLLEVLAR